MREWFNKYYYPIIFGLAAIVMVVAANSARAALTRSGEGTNYIEYTGSSIDPSTEASSDSFPSDFVEMGSVQVVWADHTNTTTFELQSSIDGSNWDTITGSSKTTSGTTGSWTFNLTDMPSSLLRVTITGTNGDADAALTPYFIGKGR